MCELWWSIFLGCLGSSVGVGSSSGLGHNYLINFKDGEHCVDWQFNGPALDFHAIEDAYFSYVLDLSVSDVNTNEVGFNIFSVELGNDLLSLESSVVSKSPGNNLEGLSELLNSVLVESGLGLGVGLDLVGELDLGSTTSGEKSIILY